MMGGKRKKIKDNQLRKEFEKKNCYETLKNPFGIQPFGNRFSDFTANSKKIKSCHQNHDINLKVQDISAESGTAGVPTRNDCTAGAPTRNDCESGTAGAPTRNDCKSNLGIFKKLSDFEILLLMDLIGFQAALKLASTCFAMHVFASHEDLWRNWVMKTFEKSLNFQGSWKDTMKFMIMPRNQEFSPSIQLKPGDRVFYSDLLYTSWRCATVPLTQLCNPQINNIDRRSNLSLQEFIHEYGIPGKPVIITDIVKTWPAFKKWDFNFFLENKSHGLYQCESVDISFQEYFNYMCLQNEESPLYLFDSDSLKNQDFTSDYEVADYFKQDLFSVLGEKRPDHKWVIIGPERSSSTFHIDPNATSAWNAVIKGSKKWILTAPQSPPPGVYPSADGSQVTSTVSLCEWYLNHYPSLPSTAYQATVNAGEMIYVPSQYWHSVLNLQDSIAITQNFVADYILQKVLEFCKHKPDQISGFCRETSCLDQSEAQDNSWVYESFVKGLKESFPHSLKSIDFSKMKAKKKVWDSLKPSTNGASFMFQFDPTATDIKSD